MLGKLWTCLDRWVARRAQISADRWFVRRARIAETHIDLANALLAQKDADAIELKDKIQQLEEECAHLRLQLRAKQEILEEMENEYRDEPSLYRRGPDDLFMRSTGKVH